MVMAEQAYGRIHRKGQNRRTFAIQMVAQDTVDVLLATIGLGKAQIATEFITMERLRGEWLSIWHGAGAHHKETFTSLFSRQ